MTAKGRPAILVIAASDSSGSAGIAADIRTAESLSCHTALAVTATTAQSNREVSNIEPVASLKKQLEMARLSCKIKAVKIGFLGSGKNIIETSAFLKKNKMTNIVIDTVLSSSSGKSFYKNSEIQILKKRLLPLADIITPNIPELLILTGLKKLPHVSTSATTSESIHILKARIGIKKKIFSIYLKGGHGKSDTISDYLIRGSKTLVFNSTKLAGKYRGTGCILSTAMACQLAAGLKIEEAARSAFQVTRKAIQNASLIQKGIYIPGF